MEAAAARFKSTGIALIYVIRVLKVNCQEIITSRHND